MTLLRGEVVGSFSDPELIGVTFDVYQYGPGSLAVQQTGDHYYGAAPAYTQTALEIAASLSRTYQQQGVRIGVERLAKDVAASPGSYYIARLAGAPPYSGAIAACAYTEDAEAKNGVFLVNALEVPHESVGLRRARFAASALLHCMLKDQPDTNKAMFLLRPVGTETRKSYLASLGIEMDETNSPVPEGLGWATVGTIRNNLAREYDLSWQSSTVPVENA